MTTLTIDSTGGTITVDGAAVEVPELFDAMSTFAHVETGLLPPGLLSFRQSGGLTQIATQGHPRLHTFGWSASEGGDITYYTLAMPWRISLGTYDSDNRLIGARVFYSPTPITTFDDPLFHANIPNINCRGYGGSWRDAYKYADSNTIGWVCLYGDSERPRSVASKVIHLNNIVSGGGAYNDGNMPGTDGTRLYKEKFPNTKSLWDPISWEKRSQEEGVDWICDPANLLPIKVDGLNNQTKHVPGGVPLTLGMALFGDTRWHYNEDKTWLKPYNMRGKVEDKSHALVRMVKLFVTAVSKREPFDHLAHGLNPETLGADTKVPDAEVKPTEELPKAIKAPAKKAAAKKAPAKKAAAKKAPAKLTF